MCNYRVRASVLAKIVEKCSVDDEPTCIGIRNYLNTVATRRAGEYTAHAYTGSLSRSLYRLWRAAGVEAVELYAANSRHATLGIKYPVRWADVRPRLLAYLQAQPAGKTFTIRADLWE